MLTGLRSGKIPARFICLWSLLIIMMAGTVPSWAQTCTLPAGVISWVNTSTPVCIEGGNAGSASMLVIPTGTTLVFDNTQDTWTGTRIQVSGILRITASVQINASISILRGGLLEVANNSQLRIGSSTNNPCPYEVRVERGGLMDFTGGSASPQRLQICGVTVATVASGVCNPFPVGTVPYCEPVGGFAGAFTLTSTGLPISITNLVPASGAASATVTITGTGFNTTAENNIVTFNETVATVTSATETTLNTSVPAGATTGKITVTNGSESFSSVSNFSVLGTPAISGSVPSSGATGALVTITGINFDSLLTVQFFNGVTATVLASDATSITAIVPDGAETGPLSVTSSGVTVNSAFNFIVLPTPTITSFSPISGSSGTSVTITGTNFGASPVVEFSGPAATRIVAALNGTSTTTTIPVTIPPNIVSGPIYVTTSGVTVTSADNFTVRASPRITTFTPANGAPSATVTISGTGFSTTPADNEVRFNGTLATVTASSESSITTTVPAGATSGPLSVKLIGTEVTATSSENFAVLETPTITSFFPESGAVSSTITINGTNFGPLPIVQFFNGINATVSASSTTSITVTVPTGAADGPITVITSGVTVTSALIFDVVSAPTITSFSPSSGAVGATVTINGSNFSATASNNSVMFNGIPATVNAATSSILSVTVPANATSGPITVTTAGVTAASSSSFTVLPLPSITNFSPTSGAVGTAVTITGTNFGASPVVQFFNGINASITSSNATAIVVTVPAGTATGPISVTSSGVTVASTSNFNVLPTPSISSFTPATGATGASVTITGTNFGASPVVQFNGVNASVTSANATTIAATVPSGSTDGPITVISSGVSVTSASSFDVVPAPTITSFSPSSGAVGATVLISGTNFSTTLANNTVVFNGTVATVTAATATSLTATVPVGATTGNLEVQVSGTGITVTSAGIFTVLPTPAISGFSPTSGAPGSTVTISGTNFDASPAVQFNGIDASVSSANASSIVVTVPATASDGPISVISSGVTVTSASIFDVLAPPAITSFTPTSGAIGATVTITGTNFGTTPANNLVEFNGTPATVVTATSTLLTVRVPIGVSSGPISVTASGITATSTSSFTVLPTPAINSFTPTSGAVGTSIIITGANFGSSPVVQFFNGINASVSSSNATTIVVTVPSGAATGPVSVTSSGVTVNSASNFAVLPTPVITGFVPASGAIGASVTISGSNFGASPMVQFNGVNASVSSANATTIVVTVPVGATTGPISVTTNGVTVNSSSAFNVLPTPAISGFTPATGAVGASVSISGTNFGASPVVQFFNGINATVTASSATSIAVAVPSGAADGPISVISSGVTVISASSFDVVSAPTITSFSPTSAAVGATVTISGTNFSTTPANNTVRFNETPATIISATSTTLTVQVPVGAATGTIAVQVSGTGITVNSTDTFTVLPSPAVTGFSPSSGAPGSTVTITGNNFGALPVVQLNGVNALVTSATATTIVVTVPATASDGLISVISSGITVSSVTNFIVLPRPVITDFNPKFGPAGTTVTISGNHFQPSPVVRFNGATATVSSSNTTTIINTVPQGATTGPICITTSGVTICSATNFVVGEVTPDDTTPPVLTADNTPARINQGAALVIAAQFRDPESLIARVTVTYSMPDISTQETTTEMILDGEVYAWTIPANEIGKLGVNYRIQAINGVGLITQTENKNVRIAYTDALAIPYASFGKSIGSYEIFSVPLQLDNPAVGDVLNELMPYNNTRWRISRYNPDTDTNTELQAANLIEPGFAYWLIVASNPGQTIFSGSGITVDAQEDYSIVLRPGWNQIGNPYDFDLTWDDIVARNPDLPLTFRTYNGTIQNFQNSAVVERMRGGFINVSSGMRMYFPRLNPDANGGRTKGQYSHLTNSIDEEAWEMNFEIHQDKISNVIGGLGMRPDAMSGIDRYDGVSMPRWSEFLDINHAKKSGPYPMSKDIVTTAPEHTWEFSVVSSAEGKPASMHWDNHYFGQNDKALMLYHNQTGVWIDMKKFNSFSFITPATFRVLFGTEEKIREQLNSSAAQIIAVAPNPSTGPVTIFLSLPYPENEYPVELTLLSLTGQPVNKLFNSRLSSGYQMIEWAGSDQDSRPVPGVYLLRMNCAGKINHYKIVLK